MEPSRYHFSSEWNLEATPRETYVVLRDLATYPIWWREVRSAVEVGDGACALSCRARLPYALRFVVRQARDDAEALVLEAVMSGDLEGFSRWTISASASGCVARFEEDVVVRKALLRLLAPVARPVFRLNHTLMMRSGHAGLERNLAAHRVGEAI